MILKKKIQYFYIIKKTDAMAQAANLGFTGSQISVADLKLIRNKTTPDVCAG